MEFNHHTIARNSLWIWRFIIENTKALCVWYQFVSDLAKAWENMRSERWNPQTMILLKQVSPVLWYLYNSLNPRHSFSSTDKKKFLCGLWLFHKHNRLETSFHYLILCSWKHVFHNVPRRYKHSFPNRYHIFSFSSVPYPLQLMLPDSHSHPSCISIQTA